MGRVRLIADRISEALGDQPVVDEELVSGTMQVEEEAAVVVAALDITMQINGAPDGQELVEGGRGLRPVALVGDRSRHRLRGVEPDQAHRFGATGDAELDGVAIDDAFDHPDVGLARIGGRG